MRVDKEERRGIRSSENLILKRVLEKEIKDRTEDLKVISVDGLKHLQGQLMALEEIYKLL